MSFNFKNQPFVVNGVQVDAYSVTMEESISYQRIDELGYSSVGTFEDSRPNGSFSAGCYLNSRNFSLLNNYTGLKSFTGTVGTIGFKTGYMTEYSISASPTSIIESSFNGIFFEKIDKSLYNIITDEVTNSRYAHGAESLVDGSALAYNQSLLSLELSFSQNVTPFYKIGTNEIIGLEFNGGEIQCSIRGTGIQIAVDLNCNQENNIILNMKNLCKQNIGNIEIDGLKVTRSSIEVNKEQNLIGSVDLIRYF